jgi:hypothetical protein
MNIAKLFDDTVLEITPDTISPTNHNGSVVITSHEMDGIGNARRRVLQKGVESNCDVIFFCDFDRLLYWWLIYPNELKVHIANLSENEFIIFGRTKAAMDTHPTFQRETERLCNLLFSYGFADYDILAACRSIPKKIAQEILEVSIAINPACIDAEWPMIAEWENVEYVKVNGLGYESDLFGIAKSWESEVEMRIRNLSELAAWLTK